MNSGIARHDCANGNTEVTLTIPNETSNECSCCSSFAGRTIEIAKNVHDYYFSWKGVIYGTMGLVASSFLTYCSVLRYAINHYPESETAQFITLHNQTIAIERQTPSHAHYGKLPDMPEVMVATAWEATCTAAAVGLVIGRPVVDASCRLFRYIANNV